MTLIGLSGYARSGKDTVAGILTDHGFKRMAFADNVRSALLTLNPDIAFNGEYFPLEWLVKWHGWGRIKTGSPQARELLQRMGTEVGREMFGDQVWVDMTLANLGENTVISDVRFPNEAHAIILRGGYVVRVNRPGTEPVNPHISETALDDFEFDFRLHNSGSVEELEEDVLGLLQGIDHKESVA